MKQVKTMHIHGVCEQTKRGWISAYGMVLFDAEGNELERISGELENKGGSGNTAVYLAYLMGLKELHRRKIEGVQIHSCSKLLVNQVSGDWACNAENLIPLLARVSKGMGITNSTLIYTEKGHNRAVKLAWDTFLKAMKPQQLQG